MASLFHILFVAFCFFTSGLALAGDDTMRSPWSVSADAPVIEAVPLSVSSEESIGAEFSHGALVFYQQVLSVVIYSTCPMEPSCSNYSMAAIKKHGWFYGFFLTMDRFLSERDEVKYARLMYTDKRGFKFHDPVEKNDAWWYTAE